MATWFVADAAGSSGAVGSDSNAGTTGAPFLTLVKAWNSAANGDTINIKTPGTWDGVPALFHTKARPGDVVPNYGLSNLSRADVTIQIDPATPTGTAVFKIPTLTGWGKNEVGGNPVGPLVAGHLWEWIDPVRLTILGDGRLLLHDYEDATHTYPSEGIKEAFSSALYFLRASGSAHNPTVDGVLVGAYAGMGFHSKDIDGPLYRNCTASTMGTDGIGSNHGTVSGFRYNGVNGQRVATTIVSGFARGDVSGVLSSVAGMAEGDLLVFESATRNCEVRKITDITGTTVTVGGWFYPRDTPGDVFVDELPLLYTHPAGAAVWTAGGTENCIARNNGRMGRNTTGAGFTNDDFGCEGIVIQKGTQRVVSYHDRVHGNWAREGSLDYNTEGGAYTFYAMATTSHVVVSRANIYDNHSPFEMGMDGHWTTFPSNPRNGGFVVQESIVHGLSDFNHMDTLFGNPSAAGAPTSLLRANPGGIFRKLTVVTDNGSPNGGFRWIYSPSAGYQGPIDATEILECIFSTAYGTEYYRFDAAVATQYGSFPPATNIDRNLLHRTTGSTNAAVAAFGASQTHSYSEAGRQSWVAKAASHGFSFSTNDKWAVDPQFAETNRTTRHLNNDFRLQDTSPAKGMAEFGDDAGAIPQPNLVQPQVEAPQLGYIIFE